MENIQINTNININTYRLFEFFKYSKQKSIFKLIKTSKIISDFKNKKIPRYF